VTVRGVQQSPTLFAALVAVVGPAGEVHKPRPFAVCDVFAPADGRTGCELRDSLHNSGVRCGVAAVNWATLDFDGGAN
jgi:hypothetical protein